MCTMKRLVGSTSCEDYVLRLITIEQGLICVGRDWT